MNTSKSVVTATVNRIKDLIKNGNFEADGKLPNERDLVQLLHVSRSSVREALRILAAEGILEIRPMKGSYVTSQEHYDASNFVTWYRQYEPEIFHLIEVRLALEPIAAELAAQRATDEQIKALDKCHEEFVGYIMENNVLKIALGDERFHELIFEAAHNPLLQNLHHVIQKLLTDYRKKVFSIPMEAMKAVSQHDEILRHIREHDSEAAKHNMIEHLLISKRGLLDAVNKTPELTMTKAQGEDSHEENSKRPE